MAYTSLIDEYLSNLGEPIEHLDVNDEASLSKTAAAEVDSSFLDSNKRAYPTQNGRKVTPKEDHITEDDVFSDILLTGKEAEKTTVKALSDKQQEELRKAIDILLNRGVRPKEIEAKLAELDVYMRSYGANYLDQMQGVLGLAYLEPNHYMNSCPATYEKLNVGKTGTKAKSVKKIAACNNCELFNKTANKCNLYQLPIVSSSKEVSTIIDKLVGKDCKNKKAALVKIANRSEVSTPLTPKILDDGRIRKKITSTNRIPKKAALGSFTEDEVKDMHLAGKNIEQIFSLGAKKVGSFEAKNTIKSFIDKLKDNKVKIALSQIDCSFLKNKLGMNNQIIGDHRCASCVYRKGMNCGLTGGNLVTFPGMVNLASNHKTASNSTDGNKFVEEFDLKPNRVGTIDTNPPETFDIEIGTKPEIGDF